MKTTRDMKDFGQDGLPLVLEARIRAFDLLGDYLRSLDERGKEEYGQEETSWLELVERVRCANTFFSASEIEQALCQWGKLLEEKVLRRWLLPYAEGIGLMEERRSTRKNSRRPCLAIVMAGNLPLVGFHDYLCGMICGLDLQVKLSSKDNLLLPFLHGRLMEIVRSDVSLGRKCSPQELFGKVDFRTGSLDGFDAIIATGSGNTFRYFEYYFGKYPHILRHNRSSCALLDQTETEADLQALAKDMFTYYGLGCRSVSKIFVPKGYDFGPLLRSMEAESRLLMENDSYRNNYDYHKSIYLVNRHPFYDTGSCILTESSALSSPMSVVYYEYYDSRQDCEREIGRRKEELQCVVGRGFIPFGKAQSPGLEDYADHVDTLSFLLEL